VTPDPLAGKSAIRPADKPDHVLVAEVVRAHGVHGAVQARLLADSWEALGRPTTLYLDRRGGGPPGEAGASAPRPVAVEWVREGGTRLVLKLGGVETRAAAAALAGCRLGLPRAAAPPLPAGRYYHYDILGLAVVDGEGRDLGRVAQIVPTGANDVYVVRGPRGEWLLPALHRIIAAVDLEAGVLRVRDVADLLES
jgi:16S rRNA processing protein RimM